MYNFVIRNLFWCVSGARNPLLSEVGHSCENVSEWSKIRHTAICLVQSLLELLQFLPQQLSYCVEHASVISRYVQLDWTKVRIDILFMSRKKQVLKAIETVCFVLFPVWCTTKRLCPFLPPPLLSLKVHSTMALLGCTGLSVVVTMVIVDKPTIQCHLPLSLAQKRARWVVHLRGLQHKKCCFLL